MISKLTQGFIDDFTILQKLWKDQSPKIGLTIVLKRHREVLLFYVQTLQDGKGGFTNK